MKLEPNKDLDNKMLEACQTNSVYKLKKIIESGYVFNSKSIYSAIYTCVTKKNFAALKFLINNGLNIRAKDDLCFYLCAILDQLDMVKYCLKKAPEILDDNKNVLLSSLSEASYQGYENMARYLISKGADIHGNTNEPLIKAAQANQKHIVQMYIFEYGMDINIILKHKFKTDSPIKDWLLDLKKSEQFYMELDKKIKPSISHSKKLKL